MVDEQTKEDEITQETAAIRRLSQAGERTGDQMTKDAAVTRAARLARKEHKLDFTNPTVAKIPGITPPKSTKSR